MNVTVAIEVRGKVQGVYYRQSTKEKAQELGLTGKVKNNGDGSVSIVASGPRERIDELVTWCHHGPARANVTTVVVTEEPFREFAAFQIVR